MDETRHIPLAQLAAPLEGIDAASPRRRDRLAPTLAEKARPLTEEEVAALERNGCTCEDWSAVSVCQPFTPSLVREVCFIGEVRLGPIEPGALQRDGLAVPVGIVRATLVCCDVSADPAIRDVGLIAHCVIGERCILQNVATLDTTPDAHFGQGQGVQIAAVNEAGGREIYPFPSMRPADAALQVLRRDDEMLHEKLSELADAAREAQPGWPGVVGDGSCIVSAGRLRNVQLGPGSLIRGAGALENVTLVSTAEAPVEVGENVVLRDGVAGPGAKLDTAAMAERFVLGENVTLKLAARLVDSVVGDNSTIACCEVVSSLLMPAHEQHHNNSFLIASRLGGQSNVAAGATIGSNHNSRSADGEIHAGRGFWPGLCTSLKHNSRFASFVLLAKGEYPCELDIPLPFSLVANEPSADRLTVMPAFWWMHNMYALVRNSWKIARRDRRRVAHQPIETDALAPDTAEEMLRARRLLEIWAAKAYLGQAGQTWDGQDQDELARVGRQLFLQGQQRTNALEVLGENMERSRRPVRILKPCQAWVAYRQMLHLYAGSTLLEFLEETDDLSPDALHEALQGPRETRWVNLGGQLVLEGDLDELAGDVRSGKLTGWDAIHDRLDCLQEKIAERRRRHALSVLELILGTARLNRNEWAHTLRELAALQRIVADEVARTRRKDDENPFRAGVYRSRAEMQAVLGTADSDEFVAHVRRQSDGIITRIEAVLKRL